MRRSVLRIRPAARSFRTSHAARSATATKMSGVISHRLTT